MDIMRDKYDVPEKFVDKFLSGELLGQIRNGKTWDLVPGQTYDMFCNDCNHDECYRTEHNMLDLYPDENIKYTLNSDGYRCDEFNPDDVPHNFLFTGCSFTFGTGLPLKNVWSYTVNHNLGGYKYFNIGINGATHRIIIADIYRFIAKYGKPKAIMAFFPDLHRYENFTYMEEKPQVRIYSHTEHQTLGFDTLLTNEFILNDFYTLIMGLEQYLETIGVPFLWTSWVNATNEPLNKANLKNYFDFEKELFNVLLHHDLDKPDYIDMRFWDRARDDHPSTRMNMAYAKMFEIQYNIKYGRR